LLERLGTTSDTKQEAAEALEELEKSPEEEKKNLTNAETNVS